LDRLNAERARLQSEIEKLVASIAAGVSPDTVAPAIREREQEVARLDVRLNLPRQEMPDIEKLRKPLTLRAEEWKANLRAEPQVARIILRRLIGPILLWEEPRPDFIRWESTPKTDLLEGLASTLDMASPTRLDNEGGATLSFLRYR
jgi:hypothetical protein